MAGARASRPHADGTSALLAGVGLLHHVPVSLTPNPSPTEAYPYPNYIPPHPDALSPHPPIPLLPQGEKGGPLQISRPDAVGSPSLAQGEGFGVRAKNVLGNGMPTEGRGASNRTTMRIRRVPPSPRLWADST
jgi:hypothetical protein